MTNKLLNNIIFILLSFSLNGQLSPGKLTESHSHIEGLKNCTQCHSIGNKIPDQKCLSCHVEIESLITNKRGLHSSSEFLSKECIDCHGEHHGRKFDMVRFQEDNFDHNLTGYTLEGQHAIIDCRSCHKSENINNPELKSRSNTFLGLEKECIQCHQDVHQGTLKKDCKNCHDFNSFSPASFFDHNETNFKLTGAHSNVDCGSCHREEIRNNLPFQVFAGISYNACTDCHENPHIFTLNTSCTNCHIDSDFEIFTGQKNFNHNLTGFILEGAHKDVNCFECHEKTTTSDLFLDKRNIRNTDCVSCHEDPHDGKFGVTCIDCHNVTSFYDLKNIETFNHDLTNFPLQGLHQTVDCKSCHANNFSQDLEYNNCYDCHNDYHRGEFSAPVQRDCNECHSIEHKFSFTSFGIEEHNDAPFILTGGHIATPCFECHLDENHWSFKNIGESCVDCHLDIHQGYISETFYPNQDCTQCHNTAMWSEIGFDHSSTEWNLTGKHIEVSCASCHIEKNDISVIINQIFVNLKEECRECHSNPHGKQFELEGTTKCIRCHSTDNWSPNNFDHQQTAFPLTGKHAEIECKLCHKEVVIVNGKHVTDFKLKQFDCINCHR